MSRPLQVNGENTAPGKYLIELIIAFREWL